MNGTGGTQARGSVEDFRPDQIGVVFVGSPPKRRPPNKPNKTTDITQRCDRNVTAPSGSKTLPFGPHEEIHVIMS
ncbi:hypothetical protein TNCV_4487411 [Trichonephila clavipes]|nr:hypothetical protein TNCV_4487411 [Trichonephila clavipes]